MKERDKSMGILWVLLGLAISIWSATFPFGGLKDPGPAFLPLGCGVILIILGVVMLIRVTFRNTGSGTTASEPLLPKGAGGRRVGLTLGGMALSAILLVPFGFVLTIFLLVLFLMRTIQPKKWRVAAFYAFVCAAGSFLVFKVLLHTQLPIGFLGF